MSRSDLRLLRIAAARPCRAGVLNPWARRRARQRCRAAVPLLI